MGHINKYNQFLNESLTSEKIKELLPKVADLISKKDMSEFINKNKEKIENIASSLIDDKGEINYNKVTSFINKNISK